MTNPTQPSQQVPSDKTVRVLKQIDAAIKCIEHDYANPFNADVLLAAKARIEELERAVLAASEDRRDAEAEANARLARAADNIATYLADSPKSTLKALTEAVIEHEAARAAAGNHKVEGE